MNEKVNALNFVVSKKSCLNSENTTKADDAKGFET